MKDMIPMVFSSGLLPVGDIELLVQRFEAEVTDVKITAMKVDWTNRDLKAEGARCPMTAEVQVYSWACDRANRASLWFTAEGWTPPSPVETN